MSYKLTAITEEKDLAFTKDNSMKTSAQCTAVIKKQTKCQDVLREDYNKRLEAL